jgi:hypothetical protein
MSFVPYLLVDKTPQTAASLFLFKVAIFRAGIFQASVIMGIVRTRLCEAMYESR